MRIAILLVALVAVGVLIVMRLAADRRPVHDKDRQPKPIDPSQPRPPFPHDDPGPAAPAGDPVPGSQADRHARGQP